MSKHVRKISGAAMRALLFHGYEKNNSRELYDILQECLAKTSGDIIRAGALPEPIAKLEYTDWTAEDNIYIEIV